MSKPKREPTAAELDALLAETEAAPKPAWWGSATPKQRGGSDPTGELQRAYDRRRRWDKRKRK